MARKRGLVRLVAMTGALISAAVFAPGAQGATDTRSFTFSGAEQMFVVPEGVTTLHAVVISADGGSANGGVGGDGTKFTADVQVQSGQVLFLEVGGAGLPSSSSFGGPGF